MKIKTVTINSLSGIVQLLLTTIFTFLAIPVFIHKLGTEYYGAFAVISVIGNLNGILSLGLNTTLVKFIAEQGKVKESNFDIAVTLLLLALLFLPFSIAVLIYRVPVLTLILNISVFKFPEAASLLSNLILANLFLILGQTFIAIIVAQQKIYLSNLLEFIYTMLYWGLILIVLMLEYSLKAIGITILISTLIWFIITVIISIKIWNYFDFTGFRNAVVPNSIKQIKYSIKIITSGVLTFLFEPITRILLSNFVSINAAGTYDICIRVKNQVWNLFSKALYPLFPLIAQNADEGKTDRILKITSHIILLLAVPVILFILFLSGPFVLLWLGTSSNEITNGIIIITAASVIGTLAIPVNHFFFARNKVNSVLIIQTLGILVNSMLIVFTSRILGFYSSVLGFSVSTLLLTVLYILLLKNQVRISLFRNAKSVLLPVLILLLNSSVLALIELFPLSIYVKMFLLPIVIIVLTTLLYKYFQVVDEEEIYQILGKNSISETLVFIFCKKLINQNA